MNSEKPHTHSRRLKLAPLIAGGILLLRNYGTFESSSKKDVQQTAPFEQKDKVLKETRRDLFPMLINRRPVPEKNQEQDDAQKNTPDFSLINLLATCDDIFVGRATLYIEELRAELSPYLSEVGLIQMESYLGTGCDVIGITTNLAGQQILKFAPPKEFNCDVEVILKDEPKNIQGETPFNFSLPKEDPWNNGEEAILEACLAIYRKNSATIVRAAGFSKSDMESVKELVHSGCVMEGLYDFNEANSISWRAVFAAPKYGLCDILTIPLDVPKSNAYFEHPKYRKNNES